MMDRFRTIGFRIVAVVVFLSFVVSRVGVVEASHTPATLGLSHALAGDVIGNQASVTYTDASNITRSASSNKVEVIVAQVAAFTLTADTCKIAGPGNSVAIPHVLTNTGNGTDTFSLSASQPSITDNFNFLGLALYPDGDSNGVPDNVPPITSSGPLAVGASFYFFVVGSVPAAALSGDVGEVKVTAISDFDPSIFKSNTDCANITANAVLNLSKALNDTAGLSGAPDVYTYTLSYLNTGNASAAAVTITDMIPAGLSYVANSGRWSATGATVLTDATGDLQGTPDTIDYSMTAGKVTIVLTDVKPGRVGSIAFSVTMNSNLGPQTIFNGGFTTPTGGPGAVAYTYDDDSNTNTAVVGPFTTNTVGLTVLQTAGVTLTPPATPAPPIFQGGTVSFNNVVQNTGNGVDRFNIVVGANTFPVGTTFLGAVNTAGVPLTDTDGDGIPDTGPLASGEAFTVVLKALLSSTASSPTAGINFTVTKTARSRFNPAVSDDATDTLTSIIPSSVDLTNVCEIDLPQVQAAGPHASGSAPTETIYTDPGTIAVFHLFINNTSPIGAPTDTYYLSVAGNEAFNQPLPTGWTVLFKTPGGTLVTSTGLVASGDFEEIVAEVLVPPGYAPGSVEVFFKIQSTVSGVSDMKHEQVVVNTVRNIAMTPNNTGQLFPGGTVVYKHTLENNGNIAEPTIGLAVANDKAGWTATVHEDVNGNGVLDPAEAAIASLPSLAVNQTRTLFVKVTAPAFATAPLGTVNVSTLTATPLLSMNDLGTPPEAIILQPISVTDNTTVMAGSLALLKEQALDGDCNGVPDAVVYVSSDLTVGTVPGACILYRITASNVGGNNVVNVLTNDATPANAVLAPFTVPLPATTGGIIQPPILAFGVSGTIIADVGTLTPGQQAVITFGVQIGNVTAGTGVVGNQSSATYTDGTFVGRTVTSNTVRAAVDKKAGVTLTADNSKPASAGDQVYFTHTLFNTGNFGDSFNLSVANLAVGDILDLSGFVIYRDANGDGVPDDGVAITNTGVVLSGSLFRFVVAATLPPAVTQHGDIQITAASGFSPAVTAANIDRATVATKAIVNITKEIDVIAGPPGDGPHTYTLTYINASSVASGQLTITDLIPAGMTYITSSGRWNVTGAIVLTDNSNTDAQGLGGSVTMTYDFGVTTANTVTATISQLGAGQSGTLTFDVQVGLLTSPQVINNTATYVYDDDANLGTPAAGPFSSNTVDFTVRQQSSMTIGCVAGSDCPVVVPGASFGSTVSFPNIVKNTGLGVDTFDIEIGRFNNTPQSIFAPLADLPFPPGTTFQLYKADGISPLTDTNGNTQLDTGPIQPGGTYTVVLQATLPPTLPVPPAGLATYYGPFSVSKAAKSEQGLMIAQTADILTKITTHSVDLTNNAPLPGTPPGAGSGPEASPVVVPSILDGTTHTFTLFVNNTGPSSTVSDTYNLAVSTNSAFSSVSLPAGLTVLFKKLAVGSLAACPATGGAGVTSTDVIPFGSFQKICAEVSVAIAFPFGQTDIYFRALSPISGASDRKHDAVNVAAIRNITLTPPRTGYVIAGSSVVYPHSLINLGNITETNIALSATNTLSIWSVEIYEDVDPDGLGPLLPNGILGPEDGAPISAVASLPFGSTLPLLIKVTPPAGVVPPLTNDTTVTATPAAILFGTLLGQVQVLDRTFLALPAAFSKSFSTASILPSGVGRLTFSITNPAGNSVGLTEVSFADTMPALSQGAPGAMVVASTPNTQSSGCGMPTITAAAGSGQVQVVGGAVAVGTTCQVSVDITATVLGSYVNVSGPVTSQELGAGTTATAMLAVEVSQPLTITKSFTPATVRVGEVSKMEITIRNPNLTDVTGVVVSDTYPTGGHPITTSLTDDVTGLVGNTPSSSTNSCGGTFLEKALVGQVSPSQTNQIELSDGVVPAGGQCVIEVPVFACPGGNYNNSTSDLTSSAGNTPPATALLKVSCPVGFTYTGNTGPGDLDCDGIVGSDDLTVVTSKFGRERGVDLDWDPAADPNCDGIVSSDDLTIVTSSFGREYF